MTWTTPVDVAAKLRRRFDSGELLRSYAVGEPFAPLSVVLHGPKAAQIGDDLAAVRAWVDSHVAASGDGRRYRIEWDTVGGRLVGRNQLPRRAHVETWDQAWALLSVQAAVRRLDELLAATADAEPVRGWVARHPLKALELADDVPTLVAAWRWLDAHRGSGRYLREVTAPGVDTKFIERHRGALAEMLGVRGSADGFVDDLGLTRKPGMVRLRTHVEFPGLGAVSEVAVRRDELAALTMRVSRVLIVENLVTYLSVPVPDGGAVLWGQGFDVARLRGLGWLADADVWYWGDLDAKGFEILHTLRSSWPQTRSVLMDRETLVRHRDRWVSEPRPPSGALLSSLTPDESAVYRSLIEDEFGVGIRLEQERIDWAWALGRLSAGVL